MKNKKSVYSFFGTLLLSLAAVVTYSTSLFFFGEITPLKED